MKDFLSYFFGLNELAKGDEKRVKTFIERYNTRIEDALISLGICSEEIVAKSVASYLDVPFLDDSDIENLIQEYNADEKTTTLTDDDKISLNKLNWFWLNSNNGVETFITFDPLINDAHHLLIVHGYTYEVLVTTEVLYKELITNISVNDFSEDIYNEELEVEKLKELASETPIVNLVNSLFSRAIQSGASDLHIEPYNDNFRARIRVDGVLKTIEVLPERVKLPVISRIKILSGMDIAEKRRPQDGKISLRVAGRELDIRVSALPLAEGESIVMRFLVKESVTYSIDSIGMSPDIKISLEEDIKRTSGVILLTGPTGSGKTTTLYSFLNKLNDDDVKIITLEDPVEYQLEGINQIQINTDIGFDFAKGLRAIVRQDPDIIMLGEIRDSESATVAMQSALTGHLVFSTVHTNDAPSAFTRLLDLGVEEFLLNAAIVSIVAQRLSRKICSSCAVEHPESERIIEDYKLAERAIEWGMEKVQPMIGLGCRECSNTGFKGRVALIEYLRMDEYIQSLPKDKDFVQSARRYMNEQSARSLFEDGLYKVASGLTTLGEVQRVCG